MAIIRFEDVVLVVLDITAVDPILRAVCEMDIVDFLKDNKLNDVRMQLQMHKFIWAPEERGV